MKLKWSVIFTALIVQVFISWSEKTLAEDHSAGWKNPSTSPQGISDFRKKAEEKSNSRWTLADWLAQKERNRMMDLWLGMYSPSPYELIFGGRYQNDALSVDNPVSQSNQYSMSGTLAFFAMAFGVEGYYENNWNEGFVDSGEMLALRVAGKHVQNTHLILDYGTRTKKTSSYNLQQQFAAADLDLYVENHSGLHGNYRYFLPTTDSFLGAVTGWKWEAGLFWDIGFVKVFGGWFNESQSSQTPIIVNQSRQGLYSGIKFFF